jgi:hypothetical protein
VVALAGCGDDGSVVPVDEQPEPELSCAQEDCLCETQADCLAYATCVFSNDESESRCECVNGYDLVGQFCIFGGVADPDFDADPEAWRLGGSVSIDPEAMVEGEMVDPGQAVFTTGDISSFAAVSQTIPMPSLSDGEPFVARFSYQSVALSPNFAPSLAVDLNGFISHAELDYAASYQGVRMCLGESAYDGDLDIRLSASSEPSSFIPSWTASALHVDSFQIEPALQGECPSPGEIMGGDFEDPMAWTSEGFFGGTAEVRDGVGLAGSSGGHLGSTSCGGSATLSTKVSIPETEVGQAIEVTWRAEGDAIGLIGLASSQLPFYGRYNTGIRSRPIGALKAPQVNLQTSRVCVPPEFIGASTTLSFTLRRNPAGASFCSPDRALIVDEVKLIESPACAVSGGGSDLDFEAVQNALLPGWGLYENLDSVADVVADDTASSGANLLRLSAELPIDGSFCSPTMAETSLRYPVAQSGELPAARFDYRFSASNSDLSFFVVSDLFKTGYFRFSQFWGAVRITPLDGGVDRRGDTWHTLTVCGRAEDSGRPAELGFAYLPGECTLIDELQSVDIDNLRLVSVPEEECWTPTP